MTSSSANNPICGPPRPRRSGWFVFAALLGASVLVPGAQAQWVQFVDEGSSRISGAPNLTTNDVQEKAYAWGDVDHDGDTDLVVVRKQPFTTAGKHPNVLLINEDGVLTDRTSEFASAADVGGDLGFLTPTNDRDVILADVNNDGWLDIVTAPTISPGDPKHIGHPRIYRNLGCSGACNGTDDWLGFRFENARIPALLTSSGQSGLNPCFCNVSAGDVTGDGWLDLWFVDYEAGCGGANFDHKLLINLGGINPGFFVDATDPSFVGGANGFPISNAFGASGAIRDMNGDGVRDLTKQEAGTVAMAFNDPGADGTFDTASTPYGGAAYFMSVGELNNDNKLDLVVSDDSADRYLLNQGNGTDDVADFISFVYSFQHTGTGGASGDDGFGGNSIIADLDNDGWNDVLITDADVDIPGCSRRMHIYRNLGGPIGSDVILQEQTTGIGCQTFQSNPSTCLVATIPADQLEGVHDVAALDINGDGWNDLVIGRCVGTEVYMNVPPAPPAGGTPDGNGVPGTMLQIEKTGGVFDLGVQLTLTWGDSCVFDPNTDYSIYEGRIGFPGSHGPKVCSTDALNSWTINPGFDDAYYLVVPHNHIVEGNYGETSGGVDRGQGSTACRPQYTADCP